MQLKDANKISAFNQKKKNAKYDKELPNNI